MWEKFVFSSINFISNSKAKITNPKGQAFQVTWLTLESFCGTLSAVLNRVFWALVILDLLSLAALILFISHKS